MREALFCKYCGNKLDQDAIFCSKCGNNILENHNDNNIRYDRRKAFKEAPLDWKPILIIIVILLILGIIGIFKFFIDINDFHSSPKGVVNEALNCLSEGNMEGFKECIIPELRDDFEIENFVEGYYKHEKELNGYQGEIKFDIWEGGDMFDGGMNLYDRMRIREQLNSSVMQDETTYNYRIKMVNSDNKSIFGWLQLVEIKDKWYIAPYGQMR